MRIHLTFFLLLLNSLIGIGQVQVQYTVTCNSKFSVTLLDQEGSTIQKEGMYKLNYSFSAKQGIFLYVSAQANQENSTITVAISCNGIKQKEATSTGNYVIASANCNAIDVKDLNIKDPNSLYGIQCVYSSSPILKEPRKDAEKLCLTTMDKYKVKIIEKVDDNFYKVKYEEFEGFIWKGWFKKCD